MAALEGLRGIADVTMHLESDAFTICYASVEVDVDAIMAKIRSMGYRPERTILADLAEKSKAKPGSLPEPVSDAMSHAIKDEKLLLLDFYASWCAPCRKLEKDLTRPEVRAALGDFLVFRVDTDRYPEVASHFNIKALPTLIVLDSDGKQRLFLVGLISPEDLAASLARVAKQAKE